MTPRFDVQEAVGIAGDDLEARLDFAMLPL